MYPRHSWLYCFIKMSVDKSWIVKYDSETKLQNEKWNSTRQIQKLKIRKSQYQINDY